jgi:hypothetical protein
VRNLLVAQHIDRMLDAQPSERVGGFLTTVGLSGSQAVELAEVLVTVLLRRDDRSGERVAKLIRACSAASPGRPSTDARFLSALALETVDAVMPQGERPARAAFLASLFGFGESGARRIRNQLFWGTVARFDFRGVVFESCIFDEVTFANCEFDASTTFRDCRFTAGRDVNSHGFGEAQFVPQPSGDLDALRWIGSRQVAAKRRQYTVEDLKEDVALFLRKFVGRGGAGLRSVEERTLRTGPVRDSMHAELIVDTMRRKLLQEHVIASTGTGYYVKPEAEEAMRFFATNNNFTGPVQEAFAELQRKIGLGK